jgi:acetyl-CoA acetyltransferase
MPVNVSGGLESKGYPIATTGIANILEICRYHQATPATVRSGALALASPTSSA